MAPNKARLLDAQIAVPQVTEATDSAHARELLNEWLDEWHKRNPGQAHPEDLIPEEWANTMPLDIDIDIPKG